MRMSNSLDPDQARQNICKNYQQTTVCAAKSLRLYLIRMHRPPDKSMTGILFFLFLNQNICCGYSKELSH